MSGQGVGLVPAELVAADALADVAELVAADALVVVAALVAADELVAVAALVAGDIPVVAAALVVDAALVAAAELAALTAGVVLSCGCLSCVTGGIGRQGWLIPRVLNVRQGTGPPMTMGSPRNLGPLSST